MGRYTTISNKQTPKGKRYKTTVKYPDIPLGFDDIYAYTDEGDRFDILAQTYYNDSNLWWVISIFIITRCFICNIRNIFTYYVYCKIT